MKAISSFYFEVFSEGKQVLSFVHHNMLEAITVIEEMAESLGWDDVIYKHYQLYIND